MNVKSIDNIYKRKAPTLNFKTNVIIEKPSNIRKPAFSLFHTIQMIQNTHNLCFCQIHNYDNKRLTIIPTHTGKIYPQRRNRNGKKKSTNGHKRSYPFVLDRSFKSFCTQLHPG